MMYPVMAKSGQGIFAAVLIIGLIAVAGGLEVHRQMMENEMQVLSEELEEMEKKAPQTAEERAQQIVDEVRSLIDIPFEVEPTVATIVDVETLRAKNPFYNKAENGDHLVVTVDKAILYSTNQKKILDIVPVQLEPIDAGGSEEQ